MVQELDPANASDDSMEANAVFIERSASLLVGEWSFYHQGDENNCAIYRAPFVVRAPSEPCVGVAYWIGALSDGNIAPDAPLGSYIAFCDVMIARCSFFEAKYAFTVSAFRGLGLHRKLIESALQEMPIVSDAVGMRRKAYDTWMRLQGVERGWFDTTSGTFCGEHEVPEYERFRNDSLGDRWRLVLHPAK